MKDERFEELREGLYEELLKANMHFKTYWAVYAAPKEIANIRNVYLSFFVTTMRSHHVSFYLALHNVVKCKPDTANFQKLFNYIRSNKNLRNIFNNKEIEKMESIIKSHISLIERIAIIRDQYIAHNQLKPKHLAEQTTYKYEEGKKLLVDLNTILEKVSRKYNGRIDWHDKENLLDINPSLNVEDMLRDLTEHRNDQRKRTRETVKQARTICG